MDEKTERLFRRDPKEVERLLKQFKKGKSILLPLSLPDIVDFAESIKKARSIIQRSTNPRIIVLETWLILDYCIKELIISGLDLHKFKTENFNLLPHSFDVCLNILSSIIKDQKKLKPNPHRDGVYLGKFTTFFIERDKQLFYKFCKLLDEYYTINSLPKYSSTTDLNDPRYRNVSENWFNAVAQLDESWFKYAKRLNSVRNSASHDFDNNNIYRCLGINGDNKLAKLKEQCKEMLTILIGLEK